MLPIVLETGLRVGVAGQGEGLARRCELLRNAGIEAETVDLAATDLSGLKVLFVAGVDVKTAAPLAKRAREAGVLVNVEDVPALCDFHVPAQVRRGDLLLTISTGGRAPGLARALRAHLERRFGPEWQSRMHEIAQLRDAWRAEGLAMSDVAARTSAHVAAKGWLS